jgi:N-ethylmaleimide reductase
VPGSRRTEQGQFRSTDDTLAAAEYVATRLSDYPLSHWMLMGGMADLSRTPLRALQDDGMFIHFRPRFHGTLIANVGFTQTRGNALLADGNVDLVAFGQPFIANPDLLARFAAHAPLTVPDHPTHYSQGLHGYTDYAGAH